jgi:long-chain fatty acid transport protein
MRGKISSRVIYIFLAVFLWLSSTPASRVYASGFGIFTQGADSLGQANATIAHTDGPSATYFNPALLPLVPGTQVEIGTTGVFPSRKFESDLNGSTEENEDTAWFPSNFYVTHQINDRFSAGLAVFSPFGLGTVWDSDWEGRTLATKSRITTFDINPAVAWRITPRLSIGAGLDVVFLDAKLKNQYPLAPTISQEFSGRGEGVGFNAGLLVQITDNLSLGAAYRSEIKIDIDGEAKFSALIPDMDGETSITLPQQVTAGLAYSPLPCWTIEAGVRWEDWESFDKLAIELDAGNVVYPRNWHSTWAYNVGTKYRFNNNVALMAGYLYGQNPIPDSTFEPAVPDSDTHLFTLGTEVAFDHLKVALAYGFQLQENRKKETNLYGDTANGEYENHIHLVGISLTYLF